LATSLIQGLLNPMNESLDLNSTKREAELIICKNCNHEFSGKYCSYCGQSIKEIERPIRFMISDFMGTIIAFDTRLAKTLLAILFKPGSLTLDFLDGKRMRYMSPFRFYIFVSFVMFLLISTITNQSIEENYDKFKSGNKLTKSNITAVIDSIKYSNDSVYATTRESLNIDLQHAPVDTAKVKTSDLKANNNTESEEDDTNKYAKAKQIVENYPQLYISKLFQFTSWSLFLFMPIFAFFLWISFFRSRKLYIGHLIFALNIHSFIFTIAVLVIGINIIFPNHSTAWTGYFFLLAPIYQVIGARKLYKRKWVNTFFKMTLVWMMYCFVWFIGLIALAAFAFIGL